MLYYFSSSVSFFERCPTTVIYHPGQQGYQVENMRKLMVMVLACVMATSFGGLVLGLDPMNPSDAKADDDGDQLTNLMEYMYGTDPLNEDTDADRLPDGYEVHYDQNRASFAPNSLWARYDAD